MRNESSFSVDPAIPFLEMEEERRKRYGKGWRYDGVRGDSAIFVKNGRFIYRDKNRVSRLWARFCGYLDKIPGTPEYRKKFDR